MCICTGAGPDACVGRDRPDPQRLDAPEWGVYVACTTHTTGKSLPCLITEALQEGGAMNTEPLSVEMEGSRVTATLCPTEAAFRAGPDAYLA